MRISAVAGAEDAPVIRKPMQFDYAKFREASGRHDRSWLPVLLTWSLPNLGSSPWPVPCVVALIQRRY